MQTPEYKPGQPTAERQTRLGDVLNDLEEDCGKCNPLTAVVCVTTCKTWRLKNQLRKINEKINKQDFRAQLLNALKNQRRLQLLGIIVKEHCSLSQLQLKMKALGHNHSQQTIVEEYIKPLIEVGLVEGGQNPYHATILGSRINELVKDCRDIEKLFPPHSECYEETVLDTFADGPKTYEDLKLVIPTSSVARVLSRLQKSALISNRAEKSYVFFFKTQRDPGLEKLSSTEDRVYQSIPENGISSKNLSAAAKLSIRRTYKYLRKLKGKKLVFVRRKPLTFSLTDKGAKLTMMLRAIDRLTAETRATTTQLLQNEKNNYGLISEVDARARNEEVASLSHAISTPDK